MKSRVLPSLQAIFFLFLLPSNSLRLFGPRLLDRRQPASLCGSGHCQVRTFQRQTSFDGEDGRPRRLEGISFVLSPRSRDGDGDGNGDGKPAEAAWKPSALTFCVGPLLTSLPQCLLDLLIPPLADPPASSDLDTDSPFLSVPLPFSQLPVSASGAFESSELRGGHGTAFFVLEEDPQTLQAGGNGGSLGALGGEGFCREIFLSREGDDHMNKDIDREETGENRKRVDFVTEKKSCVEGTHDPHEHRDVAPLIFSSSPSRVAAFLRRAAALWCEVSVYSGPERSHVLGGEGLQSAAWDVSVSRGICGVEESVSLLGCGLSGFLLRGLSCLFCRLGKGGGRGGLLGQLVQREEGSMVEELKGSDSCVERLCRTGSEGEREERRCESGEGRQEGSGRGRGEGGKTAQAHERKSLACSRFSRDLCGSLWVEELFLSCWKEKGKFSAESLRKIAVQSLGGRVQKEAENGKKKSFETKFESASERLKMQWVGSSLEDTKETRLFLSAFLESLRERKLKFEDPFFSPWEKEVVCKNRTFGGIETVHTVSGNITQWEEMNRERVGEFRGLCAECPHFSDVVQKQTPTCMEFSFWMSLVALRPDVFIEKETFPLGDTLRDTGAVVVRFWSSCLHQWRLVLVDDLVFSDYTPHVLPRGGRMACWPVMLFKALAKVEGSFEGLGAEGQLQGVRENGRYLLGPADEEGAEEVDLLFEDKVRKPLKRWEREGVLLKNQLRLRDSVEGLRFLGKRGFAMTVTFQFWLTYWWHKWNVQANHEYAFVGILPSPSRCSKRDGEGQTESLAGVAEDLYLFANPWGETRRERVEGPFGMESDEWKELSPYVRRWIFERVMAKGVQAPEGVCEDNLGSWAERPSAFVLPASDVCTGVWELSVFGPDRTRKQYVRDVPNAPKDNWLQVSIRPFFMVTFAHDRLKALSVFAALLIVGCIGFLFSPFNVDT
uniref:Calpain catalytic domain-containing protein n=1 Tax=Chromera velia CCMP2878 TaxID=1169474 RepID=A0A0G4IFP0_9ALVE|eukprot:Cvel_13954.t1-p1 / transcript=Cvel_13954.t1 / gene=Cvel_13954 / organism=Chromera_velia_CCMP2878 / gene_product=hypothetical protein / transcript_product=hypothetical protein / location=Cvel_scaffold974:33404-36247(-) / protein_length=948 / sequence_SO=supercontig / SO=protein_coding / is_pseudo=false